ncbi:MAG: hypothetical protein JOZ54_13890 [Acidobacteria bacterium]|nr:hypothetical protein [Acidobacteriota bacterium]
MTALPIATSLWFMAAASVLASPDSAGPVALRQHFVLEAPAPATRFALTALSTRTEHALATTLLVYDAVRGDRLVMTSHFDPTSRAFVTEIADVKGRTFLRGSYTIPEGARSQAETAADLEQHPELFDAVDPIVTIETASFTHSDRYSTLRTEKDTAEWCSTLRETVAPHFLEAIERLRFGFFGNVESGGAMFYNGAGQWLLHGSCDEQPQTLVRVAAPPDCAFDKSFGRPCTDAQLAIVAQAATDGVPLDHD